MSEKKTLKGDDRPVLLKQNDITLKAPGFRGEVTCFGKRPSGTTRTFTKEDPELDQALREASLEERYTLVLDGQLKSSAKDSETEFNVTVPASDKEIQYAIYQDEAGIWSFHFPERGEAPNGAGRRGAIAERYDTYRITVKDRPTTAGLSESRGLLAKITKKVIKVVVGKLLPDQAGRLVARGAEWWENHYRAFQGFHGGGPEALVSEEPAVFENWSRLDGKRTLLFIHGTLSSTAGAFGGLAEFPELAKQLFDRYEGRVIGFNHHALSRNVLENARRFFDTLGEHPGDYTFDIISHSRGGLLSRALAELSDDKLSELTEPRWRRPSNVRVHMDRLIFVATPNEGTELADPGNLPRYLDWSANMINLLPDCVGVISLGGLLALGSTLAEVSLPRISGLADQAPGSPLLHTLNVGSDTAPRYYGIKADYEAKGSLKEAIKDKLMDTAFRGQRNDLVVPTDGVTKTARFELPPGRIHPYNAGDGVHHANFFRQATTWQRILQFLR